MDKMDIDFENCYGINRLKYSFNFNSCNNAHLYAIYASNGCMKSSFTKTFENLANNEPSKDLIYPERVNKREVKIDQQDIDPSQIFVIHSYKDSYSPKQISKLLVNENLKKEYDGILKKAEESKIALLTKLKELSRVTGRSQTAETEICAVFNRPKKHFSELITEIKNNPREVSKDLATVDYKVVTSPKVEALLKSPSIVTDLDTYLKTYEELIKESPILSKKFNPHNASHATTTLHNTGFFENKHSVNLLNNGTKVEVRSHADLEKHFQAEQEKILSNPELKAAFGKIDSQLTNQELRTFRDYLSDNQWLVPEIIDFSEFKRNIWYSYLNECAEQVNDFVVIITENKAKIHDIITQAKAEVTLWSKVVETFNDRFDVPFTLFINNQDDVILHKSAPTIVFEFSDRGNETTVDNDLLQSVLSQGERRALYILNILFEIETRKPFSNPLLFIIDDIADSFDYKNKYAIIEYLYDLGQNPHCRMIMLSHNYDFHRTIRSRMGIPRNNCLFARRNENDITLYTEKYQNDVFSHWRNNLHKIGNRNMAIASIAFVRNLADYRGDKTEFDKLTSLLHIKQDTIRIQFKELKSIYTTVINYTTTIEQEDDFVYNSILTCGEQLVNNDADILELEDKVVLAITIRLLAEHYMIQKINNNTLVQNINNNQTNELIRHFRTIFPSEAEAIRTLESVNIMTPEGIHLNSFMYEPILDMSPTQLYCLYNKVKALS